jgi:MFS family permease
VLPLLVAEAVIWTGFGAMLPVMPIYFTEHGVDLPTLGLVVAAWPAARLVGEPIFGWVADRAPRTTLMVIGLVVGSAFAVGPLFITGPVAFIVLRLGSGVASSMYDPAARAYLVDANPAEKQGEAFGLYGSAQTGGLLLGPAIGGVVAAILGSPDVVFWVAGIAMLISAVLIALRVPELPHAHADDEAAADVEAEPSTGGYVRPTRLLNLLVLAAICFNVGTSFAYGSYEVIWSLYMTSLGADLALIGLSFFSFALPPLLLSPFMGRFIDRQGGFFALVIGIAVVAACGWFYPAVREIWWMVALGLVEGTAFAAVAPAIFLLVARAAPRGRSSTAQGLLGGAGTIGTIAASVMAGRLADINLAYPFYAVGLMGMLGLAAGVLLGRRRLYDAMQPRRPVPPAPALATAAAGAPFDGSGEVR